jgi:hypothetical protein
VWVCVSLALSLASLRLTVKTFDLEPVQASVCAAVFLASTPLRAALVNGQQITLELAFLTATFYCTALPWKGLWLGLSYFKYSFAPPMCLTWLFDRRYLVLSYSLVAPIVGLLGVYQLVHTRLSDLILGPVRTNEATFLRNTYGFGDIMSIIKVLVDSSHTNSVIWLHLPEIAALLGSFGAAIYLHRLKRIGEPARAALLMTLTLLLFHHLIYDYVVLLLPFAATLASKKPAVKAGGLAIICYFWFVGPAIAHRLVQSPSIPLLCANLLGLSVLTWLITV